MTLNTRYKNRQLWIYLEHGAAETDIKTTASAYIQDEIQLKMYTCYLQNKLVQSFAIGNKKKLI